MNKKDILKLDWNKRYLSKNIISISCRYCQKDILTQKWYETKNLIFLCEECGDKLKVKNINKRI